MILLSLALAEEPEVGPGPPGVPPEAGIKAFEEQIWPVFVHPRCANCHPAGDVPLQGDEQRPHTMEVDRDSPAVGLPCSTCHRTEGLDLPDRPPANGHWSFPPANQVFEGRTAAELCNQLKDPETTGGRDLEALRHHVEHDTLVLYGWDPGPERTSPAVSHVDFVAAFQVWLDAGAPCPTDDAQGSM